MDFSILLNCNHFPAIKKDGGANQTDYYARDLTLKCVIHFDPSKPCNKTKDNFSWHFPKWPEDKETKTPRRLSKLSSRCVRRKHWSSFTWVVFTPRCWVSQHQDKGVFRSPPFRETLFPKGNINNSSRRLFSTPLPPQIADVRRQSLNGEARDAVCKKRITRLWGDGENRLRACLEPSLL